jgi:hypothetical protein
MFSTLEKHNFMNDKQKQTDHLLILKDNQLVYSQPWSKRLQLLVHYYSKEKFSLQSETKCEQATNLSDIQFFMAKVYIHRKRPIR